MSGVANNSQLLKILFSVTLIVLLGTIVMGESNLLAFASAGLNIFWYWVIFKRATIRKTVYFRIMLVFLALLLLGVLFKLEYLPGASLLLTVSILGIILTYVFRTLKKRQPGLLDWLKLSWLITAATIYLGIVEHFIPKEYGIISNLLFLGLIGVSCLKLAQSSERYRENYYSNGDRKIQ